jgi:hypothetical protein
MQVGSSAGIYKLLYARNTFVSCEPRLQSAVFDVLATILAPSLHNVLRFQCFDVLAVTEDETVGTSLFSALLGILHEINVDVNYAVTRRLIRLLGIVFAGGISEQEMKFVLEQANSGNELLSICWLQALRLIFQNSYLSSTHHNPGPDQYFNFGGSKEAGLYSVLKPFPINKEYQVFGWFRLEGGMPEKATNDGTPPQATKTPFKALYAPQITKSGDGKDSGDRQSIFCMNSSESSVDICVEKNILMIYISDCRTAETTAVAMHNYPTEGVGLQNQTWYHICVKHTKPTGLNFFGSDELSVILNFKLVFQIHVRFPSCSPNALTELAVGKNFQGQIGSITVCAEGMSQSVIEFIARHETFHPAAVAKEERRFSGIQASPSQTSLMASLQSGADSHQSQRYPDLLHTLTVSADRKSHPVASKIISSYHPARCAYGHSLDVHGGRHARVGPLSFCCKITHPQLVLEAIGGIRVVLPFFPNLLIEAADGDGEDSDSVTSSRSGSSSSKSAAVRTPTKRLDIDVNNSIYAAQLSHRLQSTRAFTLTSLLTESIQDEFLNIATLSALDNCLSSKLDATTNIGLLFTLLAQCVSSYRPFEKELIRSGAIGMIEYVLQQVSLDIFAVNAWSKACLLGIIQLREAVDTHSVLEAQITSALLCNFAIWSRASSDMQLRVIAVILKDVEIYGADFYVSSVGVQAFLDTITIYFLESDLNGGDGSERSGSEHMSETDEYNSLSASLQPVPQKALVNSLPSIASVLTGDAEKVVEQIQLRLPELDIDSAPSSTARLLEEITVNTPHVKTSQLFFGTPPASVASAKKRRSTFREKLSLVRRKSKPVMSELLTVADDVMEEDPNALLDSSAMITPHKLSVKAKTNSNLFGTPVVAVVSDASSGDNGIRASDSNEELFGSIDHSASVDSVVGVTNRKWGTSSTSSADEDANTGTSARTETSTPTTVGGAAVAADDGGWGENTERIDELLDQSGNNNSPMPPRRPRDGASRDNIAGLATESLPSSREKSKLPVVNVSAIARSSAYCSQLTNIQKKQIRGFFRAIILYLITNAVNGPAESKALLVFTMFCRDTVVLEEMAQLVLTLLVESNDRILIAVTETFTGVEEFASLVLQRLVSHKFEEIRCIGIRILTHYYLRVDTLPPSIINLNSKNTKNNILSRTIERLALISGDNEEMRRFQACGGLTLLVNYIILYIQNCTDRTHAALLEMLLTKPGNNSQVKMEYKNMLSTLPEKSMLRDVSLLRRKTGVAAMSPFSSRLGDDASPESPVDMTSVVDETIVFAGLGIRAETVHDDECDVINAIVLPTFFYMIPIFPSNFRDQVVRDLLGLLRSSAANQAAFCSMPQWHVCMYSLVSQLIETNRDTARRVPVNNRNIMLFMLLTATADLSSWLADYHQKRLEPGSSTVSHSRNDSIRASPEKSHSLNQSDSDMWFSLGMNVYATLLRHVLHERDGWWEILVTISQAWTVDTIRRKQQQQHSNDHTETEAANVGKYVSQAILSHLVSEMTFTMRKTYANLKTNIKSKNSKKSKDASSKLENILFVITLAAEFAMGNSFVSTKGVPSLKEARLRSEIISKSIEAKSLAAQAAAAAAANASGNANTVSPMHLSRSMSVSMQHSNIGLDTIAQAEQTLLSSLSESAASVSNKNGSSVVSSASSAQTDFNVDFSNSDLYALPCGKHDVAIDQYVDESRILIPEDSDFAGVRKKFVRAPIFCGDCLHPLERDLTSADGSLVLVLQTLRLFDSIFWPADNSEIRNGSLLKIKRYPSHMLAVSTTKAEPNTAFKGQTGMTLFGTVIRSSLYVLTTLSPINDLATLNALRLGYLLRAAMNVVDVPHQSTPVIDWILATIVHVTLSLQRVVSALAPVFRTLGLEEPDLFVRSVGSLTPEEEIKMVEVQLHDAAFFESCSQQSTEDSSSGVSQDTINTINALFEGTGGKNLVRFVKSCFSVLMLIMEEGWIQDTLFKALDSRDFELLSQMVDRITRSCKAFLGVSNTGSGIKSRKSSVSEAANTGSATDDFVTDATAVVGGAETARPNENDASASTGRKRANSVDSDDSDSAEGGPDRVMSSSRLSEKVPAPSGGGNSSTSSSHQNEVASAVFSLNILAVLQHLRDPYLRLVNLCKSVTVVLSLDALENIERNTASLFFADLETARRSLSNLYINPANAFVEESKALKSLSASALSVASVKERSRVIACRAKEEAHIKRAAWNWTVCLHSAEVTLSAPAASESGSSNSSTGQVATALFIDPNSASAGEPPQFEFTRTCDTRLRRLVSTMSLDPKDHSDEAYFDVRQRENMLHLESARLSSLGENSDAVAELIQLKPGKMNWLKDAHNNKDELWNGIDSDDSASESGDGDMSSRSVSSDSSGRSQDFAWGRGAEMVMGGLDIIMYNSNTDQIKKPAWSLQFTWASDEKILMQTGGVVRIKLDFRVRGELLLTNRGVYFHPRELVGGHGDKSEAEYLDERWPLDSISEMFLRRYQQKPCALELFFVGAVEALFAFPNTKTVKRVWQLIRGQVASIPSPVALYMSTSLVPYQVMYSSPWTDLWRRRLISNYEYLMRINIIAGRSFNDISQYPVFPWILADYTSETLDLDNPATFRDLSKPMGALDKNRLNYYMERYSSFEADSPLGPAFMYGSHYSTEGYVVYYMIRQEPFTTLGVNLQEGRFDCPDRLFFNIQRTWDGCSSLSVSDVKELIPEFFTSPEIFLNTNSLPLGELQEGGVVDDVILPPWANGSAHEFVRLNRAALESEYVSARLPDWIDLIFGYKQTGPAAVEAQNVFHYLTYENAVDIDSIEDEEQKRAVQAQVMHYGQTPFQVFKKPHVRRLSKEECIVPLCLEPTVQSLQNLHVFTPKVQPQATASVANVSGHPIISVKCSQDRLVTVNSQYCVNTFKWSSQSESDGKTPFQLRSLTDRVRSLPSNPYMMSEETLQQLSFVPLIPTYLRRPADRSGKAASTLAVDESLIKSPPGKKRSSQIYKAPASSGAIAQSASIESVATIDDNQIVPVASAAADVSVNPDTSANAETTANGPMVDISSSPAPSLTTGTTPDSGSTTDAPPPLSPTPGSAAREALKSSSPFAADSPTASKRPLISLFGAIRKGISDFSSGSSSSSSSAPSSSARADSSDGRSVTAKAAADAISVASPNNSASKLARENSFGGLLRSASFTSSALTGSGQKAAVGAPKTTLALDEILFSDSASFMNEGHLVADRTAARQLAAMSSRCIAVNMDKDGGGRVISCGYWDNSLKVHSLESNKEIASVNSAHWGNITCVSTGLQNSHILLTGSTDCTVRIWVLEWSSLAQACTGDRVHSQFQLKLAGRDGGSGAGGSSSASGGLGAINTGGAATSMASVVGGGSGIDTESLTCVHVLRGHQKGISAIHYCPELDLVLSGDVSGTMCLHTVRKGRFIRKLYHHQHSGNDEAGQKGSTFSVDQVLVSTAGYLVSYSRSDNQLNVFWVNGDLLTSTLLHNDL